MTKSEVQAVHNAALSQLHAAEWRLRQAGKIVRGIPDGWRVAEYGGPFDADYKTYALRPLVGASIQDVAVDMANRLSASFEAWGAGLEEPVYMTDWPNPVVLEDFETDPKFAWQMRLAENPADDGEAAASLNDH